MVTGFEILCVLGGTAGLIGAVEKLALLYQNTTDSTSRLKHYHESLGNCKDKIAVWQMIWGEQPTAVVWGETGVQRIEGLKQSIIDEARQISTYVYGRSDSEANTARTLRFFRRHRIPSEKEHEEWTKLLDNPRVGVCTNKLASSLFKKFAVGLWQNALLKESMDRLRHSVRHLEEASRDEWHKHCGISLGSVEVSTQTVEATRRLGDRAKRLFSAMEDAHNKLVAQGSQEQDQLHINLIVQPQRNVASLTAYNTVIEYPLDQDLSGMFMVRFWESVKGIKEAESRMTLEDPLAETLAIVRTLSHLEREDFVKSSEEVRAQAALYIATWTSLMWNSPWVAGLCACSVRPAYFTGANKLPVFARTLGEQTAFEHQCNCGSVAAQTDQVISLGVVLATLATSQLITVSVGPNGLTFRLGHERTDPINAAQLLGKVMKCTSRSYYQAVRFCLSSTACFNFNAPKGNHTRHATDKIVEPLYQHWRILRQRREDKDLSGVYEVFRANAPEATAGWLPPRAAQVSHPTRASRLIRNAPDAPKHRLSSAEARVRDSAGGSGLRRVKHEPELRDAVAEAAE
ncbi:hypothetical protein LTR56_020239 [Elasticomyces elasticus]|nr:hypothetical protein LTR56_020239 [Elasticomyces elasticus]KAK3633450.1 hypothetical protein LTR22_020126 [Elasticomyces elasticus]KAK4907432.1 hypothetical protein LTR49_023535 [Elasticomyces elasticus]KAK5747840.1 hypothetical protein LTS12_022097 [Elasticomyces elasticus]